MILNNGFAGQRAASLFRRTYVKLTPFLRWFGGIAAYLCDDNNRLRTAQMSSGGQFTDFRYCIAQ
jgi:hypothetical protein